MNAFYEILFRGRPDGTLSGAHVIRYVGELPGRAEPVGTESLPWSEITDAINSATLAQAATLEARIAELQEQIAALQSERDSVAAELTAAQAEIARLTPPPLPASITPRQLRLYLLSIGQLAAVDTIIAGIPGEEGEAARIEWLYSKEVLRDHPLTLKIGELLGLSSADLDAAFVTASAL